MQNTVILWDLMDTVVTDPFSAQVPRFFGMTLDELLAKKDPLAWPAFELNEIDEDTLFRTYFRDRRTFDGAGLKAHIASHYRFVPGVETLLRELKTAGREMHALSNYPVWFSLVDERLDLSRYMKLSFVSCLTGTRKPDRTAFELPCNLLRRRPEAFLFVDDQEVNVEAARAAGMQAHWFRGDLPALRRALQLPA